MSQFYQGVTAGSLPPIVPTTFTADDLTIATPAANNLNVFSNDTTSNNSNGIRTTASGSTLTIQLTNRISITSTTSDGAGQTQTVTLMTPTNATAFEFTASIIGYDAVNNEAVGGSQEGIGRKSGGVVTIIGNNDSLDEADAGLQTCDWDVIASGGDLVARFIGVAGRTISWTAVFTYTQTP